ncbi:MAG: hypothetical protein Q7K54_03955 [Candidatus Parcubacteria bacterium]|nr:hypothetical protein [Candidatus Parcubacteria bacterium]
MKIAALRIFSRKIKKASKFQRESVREVCRNQFKRLTRLGLNLPVSLL